MKNFRRLLASLVVLLTILGINPIVAHAEWKRDNTGWWYTEGNSWATGWRNIDGNWYYFGDDGYMMHDITTLEGYYLNSNGVWVENSSESINSEKALTILKNAYPDYTYIGGGELGNFPYFPHSGKPAYRFTFKKSNAIFIGWVLMNGQYDFRFNNME